jgi:hypothetical protein
MTATTHRTLVGGGGKGGSRTSSQVIFASCIPRQVACSERGAWGFAGSYGVHRLVWGDPDSISWETD